MFRFGSLLVLLAASAATSFGEDTPRADHQITAVNVTGLADGNYVLMVKDGQVTLHPLVLLTPGELPPVNPPSPELTARAKSIRDAANKATADSKRAENAHNLATALSEVRKRCGTDFKGYEVTAAATLYVFDQVVKDNSPAAWKDVRALLAFDLAKMAQEGAKDDQYAAYLGEAVSGLQASAPNASRSIDMAMIMKILEIFITYILPLIIKKPAAMQAFLG